MIHIVCNIDTHYVNHCGVMLGSLFLHNRQERFHIHIINTHVKTEDKKRLSDFCLQYQAITSFYDVDFSIIQNFPIKEKDHLSLAAYLRLFMGELLPHDIKKVIYLDCDLIVINSIAELWNTNIEQVAVAAVEERPPYDTQSPATLGYPQEYSYFNSGVMLVNLAMWRKEKLLEQCKDFISKYPERIRLHDQDVLNALLYQKRKFISIRWNVMDFFLFTHPLVQERRMDDLNSAIRKPAIIHFTGKRKPWAHNCDSPYRKTYLDLAKQLNWKVISPKASFRYHIRGIWYAIMTSLRIQEKRTIKIKEQ